MTFEERVYLRSRVVLCVTLLLVAPVSPTPSTSLSFLLFVYLPLLLVLVAGTVYAFWEAGKGARAVARAMTWLLVPDLSVVAGFTLVFHDVEDAFYPIAILLTIAYALVARRRDMWVVGAAVAIAYLAGHLLAGETTAISYIFFLLKAAMLPVVGALIGASSSYRDAREQAAVQVAEDQESAKRLLESRLAELDAVVRIAETVHSSLEPSSVGPKVLDILGELLGIEACSLFVIDKTESETVFSASRGDVAHAAAPRGKPPSFEDAHFSCRTVSDRSGWMVLFCAEQADMDGLSEADELVLSAVAGQLVVAVENSHLYGLTKVLSITDELTGLFNYRELQTRLAQEVERATRYESPLSLLMIDADSFKGYNDRYGHIVGDLALAEIGAVMRSIVREVDLVARYGGEEFAVLLPETDAAGAFVVAEKIREAVAERLFPDAEGTACCRLTVSVGVATYPVHAHDRESLLHEADEALYRAKRDGKNRVRTPHWESADHDETTED